MEVDGSAQRQNQIAMREKIIQVRTCGSATVKGRSLVTYSIPSCVY
jgi:hypothetical protein